MSTFFLISKIDFTFRNSWYIMLKNIDFGFDVLHMSKRSQFGSCYKTYLFFDHRYWNMDKTFPRGIILTFHVVFVDLELTSKVRMS